MNLLRQVRLFAVLAVLLFTGPTEAAIQTIVVTNLDVPEGNGRFLIFSVTNATAPVLNNSGQIVFWASLQNTSGGTLDDTGLYLFDGAALQNIVRENAPAPGGGNYEILVDIPSLNDAGQVAFDSSLRNAANGVDNVGTYLHNGSEIVKMARRGELIPDGDGLFSQSLNTTVNSAGHVRHKISLTHTSLGVNNDLGIFLYDGNGLVKLVRENESAPEGNGVFDDFSDFKQGFNDADQVAFQATLRNTSDGFNDNTGIYLHNGTSVVNLARAGADAPEGNGKLLNISASAQVNSAGQVAFRADLRNTSGASIDNSGIYLHNGTALVNIARENQNVPEGNGLFGGFDFPLVNDAGHVAFHASLQGAHSLTDSGIYLHNGSALVNFVREGASPPEGNGQIDFFNRLHLNNNGQIVFSALMRNTSGGLTDNIGFYVTDGIETIKVARKGDPLADAVIAFLDTTGGYGTDLGLRKSFNDFGQVAFRAAAANGAQGIFLFTPELRWRSTTSGSWDSAGNWTLSLKPGTPHDVSINPTTSLTVTGPTEGATMHSLTVGDNVGVAHPTLNLSAGSVVDASAAITIKDNATLGFVIGGTDPADYARLTTAGTALLDGDLAVQFVNDFLPSAGNMFSILSAMGGLSGTFDTTPEELPSLAGGLQWQINYGEYEVVLAVVAASLPGDYNGNGTVDAADYTVWRDHLNQSFELHGENPDAATPGVVDAEDFAFWKSQFGQHNGNGGIAFATDHAVPEPATGANFALGLAISIAPTHQAS